MNRGQSSSGQTDDRRQQILDRAFDLVREKGSAGLRIRALAERVGVTEGALYRHFDSKEAILIALAERVRSRLLGPIRAIARRDDLTPRQKLEAILRHHLEMLLESESVPMLLVAEASFSEHEELREAVRRIMKGYFQVLEEVLGEMPEPAGDLRLEELATLILGLPASMALRHRLLPDDHLEERLAGPVVREFLDRILSR